MSAIMYSNQARFAIEQAEIAAKKHSPSDSAMRYAYQCGTVEAAFRTLACQAQHDSQTDRVIHRIAYLMDADQCEAADLIDAIGALYKRLYPDATEVLKLLREAYDEACEYVNADASQVELPLEEHA